MPDEDKNFGGSLVLDFRKWWRHVKTIYTAAYVYANEQWGSCFYVSVHYSLLFISEIILINNYTPQARWILSNNPLDFVSGIIRHYYSNFIHCTNSDFLIGWFAPRDTELWRNNLLDVIIVV